MMRIDITYGAALNKWDECLKMASTEANLCQSGYWARVMTQIDNSKPMLIEVTDDERLIAGLLIFHKLPFDRNLMKRIISLKQVIIGEYRGCIEWIDGPVFFTDDDSEIISAINLMLDTLNHKARDLNVNRIQSYGFAHSSHLAKDDNIARIFKQYNYQIKTWATYLVDLTGDEDMLFKELDHAARKNIKKSNRIDVSIYKVTSFEDLELFYKSYKSFEESNNRAVNPFSVAKVMWEEDHDQYYHYYLVKLPDNSVVATLGMYTLNGVATEIASSLSPLAYELKIPAQDILHWHLLLEAKRMGCHTFDLAGISPKPTNSKEEGIRRFKSKWGGKYVEYYYYEHIRGTLPKLVYNLRNYVETRKKHN